VLGNESTIVVLACDGGITCGVAVIVALWNYKNIDPRRMPFVHLKVNDGSFTEGLCYE
jgi:hypothetical protein